MRACACVRAACVCVRARACTLCQCGTFRLEVTGKFEVGAVAPGGPVPPVTPGGGFCILSRGLKCPGPAPAILDARAVEWESRRVVTVTVPTVGPKVEGPGLAPAAG